MENLPIVVRIIILAVWLFAIPAAAGSCFWPMADDGIGKGGGRLVFFWIGGQMLLWAGFQLLAVPMVVKMGSLISLTNVFLVYTAVLVFGGVIVCRKHRGPRKKLRVLRAAGTESGTDRETRAYWIVFAALLLLQLVLAAVMTYADGDDAYYVAVSAISKSSNTMYQLLPYTGGATELDLRHGLAPFPVWIAFLSRVSGIHVTAVAHVGVQMMLIPMTYGIFYLLGGKLLAGKRELLPVFLIFTEILVIFGGVSIYTTEHFMLARSRQGKTVLCSIVIPLIFFFLLVLYEKLQKGIRCAKIYWLFLLAVTISGCLCSTMGAVLICILLGLGGLCGAVSFRRSQVLAPLFLCCVPCAAYALLYYMLR